MPARFHLTERHIEALRFIGTLTAGIPISPQVEHSYGGASK
jgi:hypothetical protein